MTNRRGFLASAIGFIVAGKPIVDSVVSAASSPPALIASTPTAITKTSIPETEHLERFLLDMFSELTKWHENHNFLQGDGSSDMSISSKLAQLDKTTK